MGSPVSVVVAEIVMQKIEEQALASYKRTIPLWLRYVDDTFTTLHKHVNEFVCIIFFPIFRHSNFVLVGKRMTFLF